MLLTKAYIKVRRRKSIEDDEVSRSGSFAKNGADGRSRTGDLRFTKALLYQLSYIGAS